MTLIEMAVVVLAVAGGMFLLSGWMTSVRQGAKGALATRMLATMDRALARYHRAVGAFPPGLSPEPVQAARAAAAALFRHDKTRPLLESLPPSVRRGRSGETFSLVDPWGTPLKYVTAQDDAPFARANEGRPVFISAGPDLNFGDQDSAAIGDNLRSDDPGPGGFRPRFLAPDPATDPEDPSGEEDD